MALEAAFISDPLITFKVKTPAGANYPITIAENVTVLDLKNILSGDKYENVPFDQQRLIYSGRFMKNDALLSTYKIAGNTIHMVRTPSKDETPLPLPPRSHTIYLGLPSEVTNLLTEIHNIESDTQACTNQPLYDSAPPLLSPLQRIADFLIECITQQETGLCVDKESKLRQFD